MSKITTDEQIAMQVQMIPEMYGFLIDRYQEKLDRYIYRQTGLNNDLRNDVLQDVFIKAYQNISGFDANQSFNSWIYRICHNTIINDWKKNKPYRESISFDVDENSLLDTLNSESDTAMFAENNIQNNQVAIAVNGLNEKYRSILVLRYFEEKSYEEISDILHIPPGTVATHLSRAKKSLHKQLLVVTKQYE